MMEGAFLAQIALSAVMPFRAVACPSGFSAIADDPWLQLFVQDGTPFIASEHGIILGRLYSRKDMVPIDSLPAEAWLNIIGGDGRPMIEDYWGNYVAFLRKPAPAGRMATCVVRAPLGTLPCYWHQHGEKLALASAPDLLAEAELMTMAIDHVALAGHIAQPEQVSRDTCLRDLHAIEGGTCLTAALPRPELHELWAPWQFCDDRSEIKDHAGAAALLREVLTKTIGAQMSDVPRVLLMLSGGLDSSILAACLRQAGKDFHAFNLVTEGAKGDERHFAQMAAHATGAHITEAFRDMDAIDLSQSHAARGARPYARAFTQESERQAAQCAREVGALAVIDGGGGDNLFFNYTSLTALVEVLRTCGPGLRFWRTSSAFADLATVGLGRVVLQTLDRALRRDNKVRLEPRDGYLSRDMREAIAVRSPHPWLLPPKSILSGKAAHVALLAPCQAAAEQGLRSFEGLPWSSPLACQPVIETVLSLPIWCWFAPGLNRAAARMAFSGDLPPALIWRRTKGTPAGFVSLLLEQHRDKVRAMLLDGRLAGMGILDLDSLPKVLDDPTPARDFQFARIMELVDAEAWARSWD